MLLRQLTESPNTAVFAFGRMNPPTIGHKKLVDVVKAQEGVPFLFLTHSQKPKTDPLSFAEKVFFAGKSFGDGIRIGDKEVRTIIQAMQKLEKMGFRNVVYVAGSDRVDSFSKLLNDYNGKEYKFQDIKIISAGSRDPDAEGAEGMSASKMRTAAMEGDEDAFESGVAVQDAQLAKMMYAKVRQGMGIVEENIFKAPERTVQQQKPKIDVLNNISQRSDPKPFPLSWDSRAKGEIHVGGKIFVTPKVANKFVQFYDKKDVEAQQAMQQALRSAKTTATLFDRLGLKYSKV
ncbi:MAG: hypothetical protein CMA64_10920 [Euryarchaeota archaeon]|nr:hypothetical protein [Euryarchaeota archaeon]